MYRKCFLLTTLGAFVLGCAEGPIPETKTVSPPTQVTTNKPAPEDAAPPAETPAATTDTPAETPAAAPTEESAAEQAKRKLSEAGDAIASWAAESKDKLVKMSEEKLADLDEEIARLDVKAAELKDDAKARWEQEKPKLEAKRQEFAKALEELKTSSGDAWKTMSQRIAKAYADLRDSTKEAASDLDK